MMNRLLLTLILTIVCCGCAPSPALRRGTEAWTAAHLPSYARYVVRDPLLDAADRGEVLQNISGIRCLLDEDAVANWRDVKTASTAACACAREADVDRRKVSCMAWARSIGGAP